MESSTRWQGWRNKSDWQDLLPRITRIPPAGFCLPCQASSAISGAFFNPGFSFSMSQKCRGLILVENRSPVVDISPLLLHCPLPLGLLVAHPVEDGSSTLGTASGDGHHPHDVVDGSSVIGSAAAAARLVNRRVCGGSARGL